jgi:hypothetical protein
MDPISAFAKNPGALNRTYGYQLKTGQNAELAEAYLYHDPMTKKQNNPEYTRSQQSYRH